MKISPENIEGCFTIEMRHFKDLRGMNVELFNSKENDTNFKIEQVNVSLSKRNVLRGLHYSVGPHYQDMIVTCLSGAIRDVLVDIRIGSPTFGRILYFELDGNSEIGLFVPSGVAHGYLVKEDQTLIHYLLSKNYNPKFEYTINPLNSGFKIKWEVENPILSEKDRIAVDFTQAKVLDMLPQFIGIL